MNNILQALIPTIGKVIVALVSWGLYILQVKVKNDKAKIAIDILDDIIVATTKDMQQVLVEELKDTKAFTKGRQAEIKQKVIRQVKEIAKESILNAVEKSVNNLDAYISKKIEKTVLELKY